HRETSPEFFDETRGEIGADHGLGHGRFEVKKRAPRDIDDDAGKRLVERGIRVAVTGDAGTVGERLPGGESDRDPDVLDRVVRVHRRVALAGDIEIETSVATEGVEHVVEEGNAGLRVDVAVAVEVEGDPQVRLT